jgi:CRP-like cAMP-binding protein
MSMLSNLDLIRRVPLFSMLTADQAQAIADSVVKRRFRRGELVVEQGRKSNALFILLNGRARVLTSDTRGREVILAVLESDPPWEKSSKYSASLTCCASTSICQPDPRSPSCRHCNQWRSLSLSLSEGSNRAWSRPAWRSVR